MDNEENRRQTGSVYSQRLGGKEWSSRSLLMTRQIAGEFDNKTRQQQQQQQSSVGGIIVVSVIIGLVDQRSAVIVRSMYRISGRRQRRNDTIAMAYVRALVSIVGQHYLPAISLTTSVSGGTKACWHAGIRRRPFPPCTCARQGQASIRYIAPANDEKIFTDRCCHLHRGRQRPRTGGPAGCHMDGVFKIDPHRYAVSWQIVSRWRRNDLRDRDLSPVTTSAGDMFITNATPKTRHY